jgi:H+-translocating NAD(P) transhydrogenase
LEFILLTGEKGFFNIDLEDEVVLGSIILRDGTIMWPPPPPPPPTPQQIAAAAAPKAVVAAPEPPNPFNVTLNNSMVYTAGKIHK